MGMIWSVKLVLRKDFCVVQEEGFSITCYMCVHLTKGQAYSYEINPFSRQKGWYIRNITGRVQRGKKPLVVSLKGFDAKTVNRQS
jgi:hypothetical protein